ncbi:MAG: hypothetical protein KatS3mg108_2891 [Isosphaeraceae bacterium]|jgi:PAS domain S-box-containing protein|nr:MAG: hypothetical protein KatS3mg108_2891 [Isosphaeraceae bacterium]
MPNERATVPTPIHLRLARLLDRTSQALVILGLDRRITHANRAFEQLLGYDEGALVGVEIDAITPEESRAITAQALDRLQSGSDPQRYEKEYWHRDGHRVPVVVSTDYDREPDGQIRGYYAFVTDVGPLKAAQEAARRSESRLRRLAESLLDAIVVTDAEARITLLNPATERIFGRAAREAIGQPLDLLLESDGIPRGLRQRDPRIIGQTTETRGRHQDGRAIPLEVSVGAVELSGATEFVASMRDLTERNRLRALILRSEKLASIGLLSAGLAHEINNPLAFVANDLAMLERDLKSLHSLVEAWQAAAQASHDPACRELRAQAEALAEATDWPYLRDHLPDLVRRTRQGVRRISQIVANLRSLSRTGPAQLEPAALSDLVESALDMVRPRMSQSAIELHTHLPSLPKIPVVPAQITQVVLNLLLNAVQAIESLGRPEGNRIDVRIEAHADRQVIEISDNGIGIEPENLPRLFDPFFTTKPVGEGTGLGLAVAHGVVTAHGGTIEVESTPGSGARFRVALPALPTNGAGRD